VPFTVIDAFASAAKGVKVIEEIEFKTDAEYENVLDENAEVNVPFDSVKDASAAFDDTVKAELGAVALDEAVYPAPAVSEIESVPPVGRTSMS
jgi:hypothetical protein